MGGQQRNIGWAQRGGGDTFMRNMQEIRRVVVKIGSSSLTYDNGKLAFHKIEQLARSLADIHNGGRDVVLVSSGAIAAGVAALHLPHRPNTTEGKQAAAAVGQGTLMQLYERFFLEYRQSVAQILLTREVMEHSVRRRNAANTFDKLFEYDVIPIVNENDTIATDEIEFGDNDRLSAYVAELVGADLLILLSDIDGLYTADPSQNADAQLIREVREITPQIAAMAGDSRSSVGTGGMATKIMAAQIAGAAGIDMVIANAASPEVLEQIFEGMEVGTYFYGRKS